MRGDIDAVKRFLREWLGFSWAKAAVSCGGTAGDGERLRRKVKRLSKSVSAPAAPPCLGRTETPEAGAVGT